MGCALSAGKTSGAETEKLDPAATRHYAVAVGLQNKKLAEQAAARWTKFIQAYPKDPRLDKAHHYLGICQLRLKKFADAAATFRTVLTKYPKFASRDAAQLNLGLALYNGALASKKEPDLRAAAQAFAEVPAKFAKSQHAPTALFYQAECFYSANDLAGAVSIYKKFLGAFPKSELLADVRSALGSAQQELGEDGAAAATFQAFLEKFPKHEQAAECRLRLGLSLFNEKKYADAEKILGQAAAVAEFPYADLAVLRQAQCLYELGKLPEAAALYQSLPKKFPKSPYQSAALLAAGCECSRILRVSGSR